ncbi:MAG: hypothetical protein A2Z29_02760 [Chloroflexi bacterium RBG_16_56_11]|nr:MAG: hypothetical protein A2Z29_02760 [Chloroflexi bacterium RBG_16_56_11]
MAGYIALAAVVAIVLIYFVIVWVLRTYRQQVAAGREELIGKTAVVEVALRPKGVVFVEGERWTAVIDGGQAEAGEEVKISRVDGLKLMVSRK